MDSPTLADGIAIIYFYAYPPSGQIRPQYERKENRSEHQQKGSKIMHANAAKVQIKFMENHQVTLTNSHIWEVLSVQTKVHRKASRLGLIKQGAHLVDSRTSGRLTNTTSRPKSVSTTATLNVLMYGAECRRIVTTDVNKLNAFHNSCLRNICNIYWPKKSPTTTCTRRLDIRTLILRLRSSDSDD